MRANTSIKSKQIGLTISFLLLLSFFASLSTVAALETYTYDWDDAGSYTVVTGNYTVGGFGALLTPNITFSGAETYTSYTWSQAFLNSTDYGALVALTKTAKNPCTIEIWAVEALAPAGILGSTLTVNLGLNLNTPNFINVVYDDDTDDLSFYSNWGLITSINLPNYVLNSTYTSHLVDGLTVEGNVEMELDTDNYHDVTVVITDGGTLNYPETTFSILDGETMVFYANPSTGYYFENFTRSVTPFLETDNPLYLIVEEDQTVTVYFTDIPDVTPSPTPDGMDFDGGEFIGNFTTLIFMAIAALFVFAGLAIMIKSPAAWVLGIILLMAGFFGSIIVQPNVYGLTAFAMETILFTVFLYNGAGAVKVSK